MKNLTLKTTTVSVLLLIFFFACKREEPIPPTIVEGKVIDFLSREPLEGVEVRLFQYSSKDFEEHIKFNKYGDNLLMEKFITDKEGKFRFLKHNFVWNSSYYLNLINDTIVSSILSIEQNQLNTCELEAKKRGIMRVHIKDTSDIDYFWLNYHARSEMHFDDKFNLINANSIDTTLYMDVVRNGELIYGLNVHGGEFRPILIIDTIVLPDVDTAELNLQF